MIKAKPFGISKRAPGLFPQWRLFICERPDTGSRMSREAHVRFCERAVVKSAARLALSCWARHICGGPCESMIAITIPRERIDHWTRMRRSHARFSRWDASCRALGGGLHHQYFRI